jgi:hypothetical protein
MMSGDNDDVVRVDDPNFPSPPPKRWRVYCDGELVEMYDTAKEAWEGYTEHREKILPVMLKTQKRVRYDGPRRTADPQIGTGNRRIVSPNQKTPQGGRA